jgi:hypothetical protein
MSQQRWRLAGGWLSTGTSCDGMQALERLLQVVIQELYGMLKILMHDFVPPFDLCHLRLTNILTTI